MKKIGLFLKNLLFGVVEIPLDIVLFPVAMVLSLLKRVNKISTKIDRRLNDIRLTGRQRK